MKKQPPASIKASEFLVEFINRFSNPEKDIITSFKVKGRPWNEKHGKAIRTSEFWGPNDGCSPATHEVNIQIFEAVDATDDEVYHTIGLFASLESAVSCLSGDDPIEADGSCYEDSAVIHIRERKLGFCNAGNTVAFLYWTYNYELSKWMFDGVYYVPKGDVV